MFIHVSTSLKKYDHIMRSIETLQYNKIIAVIIIFVFNTSTVVSEPKMIMNQAFLKLM